MTPPRRMVEKVVGHCPICGGAATAGATVDGVVQIVIECRRKDIAKTCPVVAVLRDQGHDRVMQ